MISPAASRRRLLSTALVFLILAAFFEAAAEEGKAPLMAYVGTFSSPLHDVLPTQVDLPPGNGRGIHLFEVDRVTGALKAQGVVESGTSPSCLAVNSAGTRMYSANETDKLDDGKSGSISSYAIDRKTGQLTLLNSVSSGGAGPTYLSIHPSGKFILVANYFGGSVAVLPVLPDGKLGPASDIKKDTGTVGPKMATSAPPGSFAISGHDVPHAHMIEADPSGRFVLSTDLGLDQILSWRFDHDSGVLTPSDPPSISLAARRWSPALRFPSEWTLVLLPPGRGSDHCII
jgi:6-phosphogluconolactonase (cycloisomerase 2 family)